VPDADRRSSFALASVDLTAPGRRCWWSAAAGPTAARRGVGARRVETQDAPEGASEVRIEDGVDDRIEEAVDVAEPRDEAHDGRRDRATTYGTAERPCGAAERPHGAAERPYGGDGEERKPADDECAGDDGEGPRRLPLPATTSSTLPVSTQLRRVAAWRRTTPRQNLKEVVPVSNSNSKGQIPLRYPASESARELIRELVCDLLAS